MHGFLLDTHAVIWLLSNPNKLSKKVQEIIKNPNNHLYYSLISMSEIAIKANLGKLEVADNWQQIYQSLLIDKQIEPLEVTWQAVNQLQKLPLHHKDPFDRILIACAIANNLALISIDEKCILYDLPVVW